MMTAAELARMDFNLLKAIASGHDIIARSYVSVSQAALMAGEPPKHVVDVLGGVLADLESLLANIDRANEKDTAALAKKTEFAVTPAKTSAARKVSPIYDLINRPHGVDQMAIDLKHLTSFLMNDLEDGLRLGRGEKHGVAAYRFIFSEGAIDDTLWLIGRVYSLADDLHGLLAELRAFVDHNDEAIAKALPEVVANA